VQRSGAHKIFVHEEDMREDIDRRKYGRELGAEVNLGLIAKVADVVRALMQG
jgi:hypothetical protein